ncbi:MAG: type II toxin-antitoxin system RelE/ParE family toxin [Verrucomicrobiaceae bacterium]|nr:type II toxin-antitoxin system RelE/ParE family toxin [Verrucomicrobiaceae bacterium]
MNVRFEEEAWIEYQEAAQYSEDRFGLGRQFVAAVQVALSDIAKDPERYQRVGQRVHIFRMKRFPYYLFYQHEAEQETVTIYAVSHHKRRPDYWRGRLWEN